MTIAVCYLSPEGVILGADSTSSAVVSPGGFHYFNHNQKLFELGEKATLGVVTWGLGGLGAVSYRTLFAQLADDLKNNVPANVGDVVNRWTAQFWNAYTTSPAIAPLIARCKTLAAKPAFDPAAAAPAAGARSKDEEEEFSRLKNGLVVGFCIAGYVLPPTRTVEAFQVIFDPLMAAAPVPAAVTGIRFWGAPSMIDRLLAGCDTNFKAAILASPHWAGNDADLTALIMQQTLTHAILPVRDAIDFVHTCIFSTIKAMKFSNFSQICGGPIELAVITTDRLFRWVRHKDWDAAIVEGVP